MTDRRRNSPPLSPAALTFTHSRYRQVTARSTRVTKHGYALAMSVFVVTGLLGVTPASAELKLCNSTASRVGVAIGYQAQNGWMTEGWWNIPAQTCESLLKSTFPSRYIYVYAIDYERGGEWKGAHTMCIRRRSFAIRNVKKCKERGYGQAGFFEVDTGESKTWTIRLSDPDDGGTKNK